MSTDTAQGRFRRALKKLSATPDEMEADEIGEAREKVGGCRSIADLKDRELVSVYGHVKHVTLAPRAGTPTLEAALYDGSGVVTLVWLGRRTIAGVKPGANLVAHGRVSCHEGRRIIHNPRYELRVP